MGENCCSSIYSSWAEVVYSVGRQVEHSPCFKHAVVVWFIPPMMPTTSMCEAESVAGMPCPPPTLHIASM